MLAKIIVHGETARRGRRAAAATRSPTRALAGIETNLDYLRAGRRAARSSAPAAFTTSFLERVAYRPRAVEVLDPGTQTTVQDYPGRLGYWHVGVPPSGPMDALAFRLANRLVGNAESRRRPRDAR